MSDLTELYQAVILDHNKRPRNRGKLPSANRVATGDNPTCGDNCTVYLRVETSAPVDARGGGGGGAEAERIAEISFEGAGCAISQASASLMTTQLKGRTTAEAEALYQQFHDIVSTGRTPGDDDPLAFNELAAFAGVHAYPARIKCATLAWHAALEAIKRGAPPAA